MAYSIINPIGSYQAIAENSATKKHELGLKVQAVDPTYFVGEFVYAKGVASCAVGSWVTLNQDDWSTALLAADAVGSVGVAMAATVSGEYGWFQIYGKAIGKAANAITDAAQIYAAGSGTVDDAVVDGDMVHNAKCASTITGAGTGEFQLYYPYTDNINSND